MRFFKNICLMAFLSTSISSYASGDIELQTSKAQPKETPEYSISSSSCKEIEKEIWSLISLKLRYDGHIPREASLKCSDPNKFIVNDLLPNTMNRILGMVPEYFGPNCWNSVLNVTKLSKGLRYTTQDEYQKTLDQFSCQKKNQNQRILPGDIIRIYNNEGEDFHSFIYISPNISFTKNGPSTRSPYELSKTVTVLEKYNIKSDCFLESQERIKSECTKNVEVYNCHQDRSYTPISSFKNLQSIENDLTSLLLTYRQFKNKKVRFKEKLKLSRRIDLFLKSFKEDLNNGAISIRSIEQEYLFSKIEGIKVQLNHF